MVKERKKEKKTGSQHSLLNQVHELHRLYHVQRQLTQAAAWSKPPNQEFRIIQPANPQQKFSFSSTRPPAPAPAEDCSLELTLATGPSSIGSGGKRLKTSSNSDSGTTAAASSTSTESELVLLGGVDVTKAATVRFQSEAIRRMDGMGQGAWMHQCLSLKTA
jgi:hypothetical protein